jgi:hypothetical protein
MNLVQDSDFEGVPTTRRFARTTSEAFADERAHCIEGPSFSRACRLGHIAAWLIPTVVSVAVVVVGYFVKGA